MAGIDNRDHETVEYTLVIQLQREEHEGDETIVLEREELDRVTVMLGHNETWLHLYEVASTMVSEDLRLTYLLYVDDVPEVPTP